MATLKLPALLITFCGIVSNTIAQPSLEKMQQNLVAENKKATLPLYKFELNNKMKTQAGLLFSPGMAVQKNRFQAWLAEKLDLRQGLDVFLQKGAATDYAGTQIIKLQQYYKGIRVEHGIISEVDKGGLVQLLQLEFYSIPGKLPAKPTLSEEAAFQKALSYVGAEKYVWDQNVNNNPDWNKPRGELVIVEDIFIEVGKMCLAYKFNVYALKPESRQFIYIDALTGNLVFRDAIIKNCHHAQKNNGIEGDKNETAKMALTENSRHTVNNLFSQYHTGRRALTTANIFGVADTRYSGQRTFFTSQDLFGQYQLQASGIGDNASVTTLNCISQPDISLASPIHDNDNVWSAAEFPNNINMALDVHWGAQKTMEYWWKVHGRKSFDNNNGDLTCYVFYTPEFGKVYDNAKWDGKALYFGEGGFPPDDHRPWASIDILAHEFGHAICDYTANLAYQRESGALNEGFSDIWGACAKNFIKDTILPLTKKQWIIGDEIAYGTDIGLRSMENPQLKQQPDTYLDLARKWQDAGIEGCPVPEGGPGSNDQCGVHTNSGVLNHWFYLLSKGGTGLNGNFFNYTVDSFGIEKTQRIAFYTEQILTPNSGFESARIASQNAVLILASVPNTLGITASDTTNVNKAWKAVGVINDSVFKMSNTPAFTTEAFNTVAVGKFGAIWAGTSNNGLYRYDGREWKKAPDLTNHNISDIKPDINGRIWIAQYGRTGSQALGGGLGCYNDSAFASYRYYTTDSGLPTRNIRSLYINNLLLFDTFKRVWVAAFADITTGNSRPGFVVRGRSNKTFLDFNYKPFNKIESGVDPNFGYCQTIGGSDSEVWVSASNNGPGGINQILRYKTADSSFIGFVDYTNSSLPAGFNAKAIYFDSVGKRWWVGMTSGGVYVYNTVSPGWTQINFPSVFPPGTIINNHAITGDTKGNIHIGTSNGYVRFGSVNSSTQLDPTDQSLYKIFTKSDGLPSNNVKSIAVDYRASRLIIATDSGILFKYNLCKDCINKVPVYTIATGSWNDPSTWQDGKIPGEFDVIVIRHPVTITQNANCKSLAVRSTGSITVNAGVIFSVQGVTYVPNGNK